MERNAKGSHRGALCAPIEVGHQEGLQTPPGLLLGGSPVVRTGHLKAILTWIFAVWIFHATRVRAAGNFHTQRSINKLATTYSREGMSLACARYKETK